MSLMSSSPLHDVDDHHCENARGGLYNYTSGVQRRKGELNKREENR